MRLIFKQVFLFFLFRSFSDRGNLKISQYYMYFGAAVKKWLSVARNKILHRIERAVDRERFDTGFPPTYNVKFTPSSLDVSNCFSQISQFWRRLGKTHHFEIISTFNPLFSFLFTLAAWPDIISSISYLIKITEDMANAARLYAQLLEGRLTNRKYSDNCDIANSMVEVRRNFSR